MSGFDFPNEDLEYIPLCDTCDGTKTGKAEVDWSGEQHFPCTCPSASKAEHEPGCNFPHGDHGGLPCAVERGG